MTQLIIGLLCRRGMALRTLGVCRTSQVGLQLSCRVGRCLRTSTLAPSRGTAVPRL